MTISSKDRIYGLLPALYRLRDAGQGESLRALLAVIDDELRAVEADIDALYDDWFIETGAGWVVPYIGDLLGVRGLYSAPTATFSQRAYVANTLSYRRRKGTARVLEDLARDVTGWPARAVEFFELLSTTQYLNHIRLFNRVTPDLRDIDRLDLLDGPFDGVPHTGEVRHINNRRGKYNIPNIGLFLWRLQNYPLSGVTPRQSASHSYGYSFSPLGNSTPLFNAPLDEPVGGFDPAAGELSVPARIRPAGFHKDLADYQSKFAAVPVSDRPENTSVYGPRRSLQVVRDGIPVPPIEIFCMDLRDWNRPPAGRVAVDVARGRITFAAGEEPEALEVGYNYGFSADIGGGPYVRASVLSEPDPTIWQKTISRGDTLAQAVLDWTAAGKPKGIIFVGDSATYDAAATIDLPAQGWLVIEAIGGVRPHFRAGTGIVVNAPVSPAPSSDAATFILSGLLIEGHLELQGKVDCRIADCTIVPGRSLSEEGEPEHPGGAALLVQGADVVDLSVRLERCIAGPVRMPGECKGLAAVDSILDAPEVAPVPRVAAVAADDGATQAGPVTTLERCTVTGKVFVKELALASESIFMETVVAERRQTGCVRFSHVPKGSRTPRRFRCQPDLALAQRKKELDVTTLPPAEGEAVRTRVRPEFTRVRYGQPAYLQLGASSTAEIRRGAEDQSEMGVFCMLKQPQREGNLRIALDEYLRFGLEAGMFFVT